MTDRELIQMALDALENAHANEPIWKTPIKEAIKALRSTLANEFNPDWDQIEALQESLREHMAEIQRLRARLAQHEPWVKTYSGGKPNYTEPCERCGEVNPAEIHTCTPKQPFEYWNAVEGWVKIEEVRQHFDTAGCGTIYKTGGEGRVPLYAAREWQGLTDEEIIDAANMAPFETMVSAEDYIYIIARAIEAKLREKNA